MYKEGMYKDCVIMCLMIALLAYELKMSVSYDGTFK
jgi:hypothetical protein